MSCCRLSGPSLVLLAVGACVLVGSAGPAWSQGQHRVESVNGPDGWPIRFSYYPALEKLPNNANVDLKKAPVAILLHGANSDRTFWDKTSAPPGPMGKPFAETLQSQGFAVVAVDLRKHGESVREGEGRLVANDYELMVGDLLAVKNFLFEQHQQQRLNMAKLVIIALDDSVPVAAAFAEYDARMRPYDDHAIASERTPRGQIVRSLVMVSPSATAGKLQAASSLRFLGSPARGLSFMVVVGKKDSDGERTATTLYKLVDSRANADRVKFEAFETNEKSEHLFGNPRVRAEIPILVFLKTHVLDLDIPWQDRRSRTERE